jgi:pimeloyl-ACP methyl ester carboxylesterase
MDFVLIPGAWMGEWVWEPVTDRLRAFGHRVHPVTLSGLDNENADVSAIGLETHVGDVMSVLEEKDLRNVIVVGHSYSGVVTGQVADRAPDRVSHTVFVEAFLPHDRKSMLHAFPEPQREDELRQIAENDGRWPAPDLESVADGHGLSVEQARWLTERLVDHPGRTVSELAVLNRPLAEQRATYVACSFGDSNDVASMRGEPNWSFRALRTGHWPMVSAPAALTKLLAEVASEHEG